MRFGHLVAASGNWLDGLLGLRELSLSAGDVSLRLAVDMPAWGWALIALTVAGFVWWVYHRLMGGRRLRLSLAVVRGLVLTLIVLLLCGPEAVRQEERVEADVLVMLVDRSASLGVEDVGGEARMSRDTALRDALATQWPEVAAGLADDREVRWLGFGERVFGLGEREAADEADEAFAVELGEADQLGTRLRTAVEEAVRRVAGRAVAGVVVISDGRSGEEVSSGLIARLGQSAVRVFSVPLGAADGGVDVAVVRIDGPRRAFAGDVVPVSVGVEVRGTERGDTAVRVRLIDTRGTDSNEDDEVLDERTLSGEELRGPVRLEAREVAPGDAAWAVEVGLAGEGNGTVVQELNESNNRAELSVEVVDRPIRVLYVEGTPRWEYRYLKNLLVREPSIDSSILLLSADAEFAQEGDTPITRLPADAEEWGRYDVVILGDVPAAYFGDEQVELLRERVSRSGVGMLWVAGPRFVPGGWAGTRLSDLLPMREPGEVGVVQGGFVEVEPTGLAEALAVLQLGDGGSAGGSDWPAGLGALRWVQELAELKPTAEVLAVGRSEGEADDEALPVVTRMRYGAGQSVYVATDETWRWRRGVGERFPERFYVQLVRMLGRGAVAVDDARVRLEASRRRVSEGGSVVLDLVVEDPALLPGGSSGVRDVPVQLTTADTDAPGGGVELLLREVRETTDGTASSGTDTRRFSATWTADQAGAFIARVTHPALESLDVQTEIEVAAADDELRNPEADHAKLIQLADATGGAVIPLDRLDLLSDPETVPSVARRIADDRTESIAHSPLAFALLIGLLALEWSARRAMRLA
ncbi:MAG: hypothetical protein AAGF84_09405 [Planctomycetota bacterium]